MAEDPQNSAGKSTPPPPDVAKSTPPPAPPAPPAPPQQASSEPPLKMGGGAASSVSAAPVVKDAPGDDASIGNRIVATILDLLVAAGVNFGAGMVMGFLHIPGFASLSGLLGLAYLLVRDSLPFLDGQSVGKKAMKLRAVTLDGQALTGNWNTGLLRNVLLIIPIFGPLIELIVLLTRQDKPAPLQRLGDEWAKTKVINVGPDAPATTASSPPPAPPQSGGPGGGSSDL